MTAGLPGSAGLDETVTSSSFLDITLILKVAEPRRGLFSFPGDSVSSCKFIALLKALDSNMAFERSSAISERLCASFWVVNNWKADIGPF